MILSPAMAREQEYQSPESAAYDASGSRCFISNFSGGEVLQLSADGALTVFQSNLSRPLGMILVDTTLYVIDNPNTVAGYDISDGAVRMNITIAEAVFLNDITADSHGFLYVTDSNANSIYRIDTTDQSYSRYLETEFDGPNGIICDNAGNRLIVCYFNDPSYIQAIDLRDKSVRTLADGLINLDGIAMDSERNVYVSCWGPGSFADGFKQCGVIYKFNEAFSASPEIIQTRQYGPADIYFDSMNRRLIIPYFLDNIVEYILLPDA